MPDVVEFLARAFAIGVGATLVMDLWALLLRRLFGIIPLNYAFVGRWIGHMGRGRLSHDSIAKAPPVAGEAALGWLVHYAIGIAFAAALLGIAGPDWARAPSVWPALAFGLGSVLAPFLILQPALGLGLAGSRTPKPGQVRLRSLMTHAVFGLGLFASAWLLAVLAPSNPPAAREVSGAAADPSVGPEAPSGPAGLVPCGPDPDRPCMP